MIPKTLSGTEWTILGGTGFVGSYLYKRLTLSGARCRVIHRGDALAGLSGHVVYCIGVTADFRTRPGETVEAHTVPLLAVLRQHDFASLTYLSSTRLYRGARSGRESAAIPITVSDADRLYDISKLAGESLCLNWPSPHPIRIVRLSNLYGGGMSMSVFLGSILTSLLASGRVTVRENPATSRDYLSVDDAVDGLIHVALHGTSGLYNVAIGRNTSHRQLAGMLHELTGGRVDFAPNGPIIRHPTIATSRLAALLRDAGSVWRPVRLQAGLAKMVGVMKNR